MIGFVACSMISTTSARPVRRTPRGLPIARDGRHPHVCPLHEREWKHRDRECPDGDAKTHEARPDGCRRSRPGVWSMCGMPRRVAARWGKGAMRTEVIRGAAGTVAVALTFVAGPGWAQDAPAEAITVEAAEAAIEITDDALETDVTFSSVPVGRTERSRAFFQSFLGVGNAPPVTVADPALRAWRNKTTGNLGFQVYVHLEYTGAWHFYESATYLDDGQEARNVPLVVIKRNILDCRGSCWYYEIVGFDVPERVLRALAVAPTPGRLWTFRLRSKHGGTVDVSLQTAEIAGLLRCIDAYPKTPRMTK